MILVLDTHVVVWFLSGDLRLSPQVKQAIQKQRIQFVLPIICVAEIFHLQKKGRIPISIEEVKVLLGSITNMTVFPIDMQVIDAMPAGLDIHDALIVATSLLLKKTREDKVFLATMDKAIIQSGLVEIFW